MNDNARQFVVEVCVGSVADVEAAAAADADRVELCGGLELGGLTPSWGLAETVLDASPIAVVAMLRPRAGGFCYDRHEFAAMLRDGERLLAMGASGLAFGVLNGAGCVDLERSRDIVHLTGSRQSVFHRAFDFAGDRRCALDALVDIGCTRILTSGGAPTALEGADAIRALIEQAGGRIEIMAGGRIGPESVGTLIRRSHCTQVHLGASAACADAAIANAATIDLCDARFLRGGAHRVVSGQVVRDTVAALRASRS
jgi:copper homeostasis protein